MPELALPVGVMRTDQAAAPRIELSCARTERRRLRDWFERLAGFGFPWLALPESVTDSSAGLSLAYPAALRECPSVAARTSEWGHDVATAFPLVLGLARFTLVVADGFARHQTEDVPVCPGLVFARPDEPTGWCLIALPTRTATLADWAKSGPAAWGWASPALLDGRTSDPVHTLGAALHQGLVGSLFPEALHDRERFARLLRGRVGMPARLDATIRAATPARSRSDADELRTLALACLDPRAARRPSLESAAARFAELEGRMTADRLARHWEADNRPGTADKLRRQAAPAPPKPKPEPAPPALAPNQEWSELARETLGKGDVSAALSMAWNAVFAEGPGKADLYLMIVQRAASLTPARTEIVTALTRLEQAYSVELIGEANMLRVAHIRMRYLAAAEADVWPLLRTSHSDWAKALGLLLRAVFAVRKSGGYVETSRLCGESGKIFARMPQGGGESGKYGRAYLGLLDGVAHIGFVASGGSADYYSDALNRFGAALQLATEVKARDLLRAATQWLNWLAYVAGLTPTPAANTIRTAAEALLHLFGGTGPGRGVLETPEVPAYDEAYLFPV